MDYFEWNKIIASYFFNSDNSGKEVFLYISKQDLIKFSKNFFESKSDDEIWINFINSIIIDLKSNSIFRVQNSPIDRPLELYNQWNKIDTPPFLSYLILFIIPLTESYDIKFSTTNYYGKINKFFKENKIIETENYNINTNNFKNLTHLWNALEEWSIIKKDCELGYFELKKFGNPLWIYVGKPLSQCILSPKSIKRIPEFFDKSGLVPNNNYSKDEFKRCIIRHGVDTINLSTQVINLVKNSDINELGNSIVELIIREYKKWTGESIDIDNKDRSTRKDYIIASLFLQLKVNEINESISLSYRLYSKNEYPEDLEFGGIKNLYELNGWSKTLALKYEDQIELKDEYNKWIARFPFKEVRLFMNATNHQLSSSFLIETNEISIHEQMYILCKNSQKKDIENWGSTFEDGDFLELNYDGLPEGFSFYKFKNPTRNTTSYELLNVPTEKKIVLKRGLKLNFRTYIKEFLPDVVVENSFGDVYIYGEYKDKTEKFYLNKIESANIWKFPENVNLDSDFYLKIEGDKTQVGFSNKIISSENYSTLINSNNIPKRDKFGNLIKENIISYYVGNNIACGNNIQQSAYVHLFKNRQKEKCFNFENNHYTPDIGDEFLEYLTVKDETTNKDFFESYEHFYLKLFNNNHEPNDFNILKIKKASLKFYDYLGFIDYDYLSHKIKALPPQLIFIPSKKGRKVLLTGGRDRYFINNLISVATKYNLKVELLNQFNSNKYLILPRTILLRSFGSEKNNFGENKINNLASELNIKFHQFDFIQVACSLFSANITEYEKELFSNEDSSSNDYDWARKIFNYKNLKYEKNTDVNFDKSYTLVEYKLNEYTFYNKLWKNGNSYDVDKDWGKFLILNRYQQNIIIYDNINQKVAIPIDTPLPRLIAKSVILLSGTAPEFREIDGRYYRVYENIPSIFTDNILNKLGQRPINKELK